MGIEEALSYLNVGIGMLIIDIALRRMGFDIKLSEYRKHPKETLIWGLALLVLNSGFFMIAQAVAKSSFPEIPPLGATFFLILTYLFVATVRIKRSRKR